MDHGMTTTSESGQQMGLPPPLEEVKREAGSEEVDTHVLMRQKTVNK